jgi:hypothetical protein
MEIGRSTPRHQELALLYPRSRNLQAHINEYYIVVVRFCHDVLQFALKSVIRQFTTTLSGTLIKTTQSNLDLWASEIKDDISILVAKKVEEEATDNSKFRSSLKKASKTVSQQQQLTVELRILDECSKYDHQTTWKQIRKSGNTTLFAQKSDYLWWTTCSRSSTLLYYGKLGYGKSVMMANIVDDLNLRDAKQDVTIAYFFVRHDLPDSLKARTIIGSIARQLLQSKLETLNTTPLNNWSLDTDAILALLRASFSRSHKTYLVLDGLNLCNKFDKAEVINFVGSLQESAWVLACVSFREEPDRKLDTTVRGFRLVRVAPIPDNSVDISAYIEAELARCLDSRALILGDAALILEIQDALLKGSNGMFLWVALQIKSLCTMQTDEDMRQALATLPSDLPETYLRILKKSERPGKSYQTLILELITSAQRPLEVDELKEALSVTPGNTDWTAASVLNEVYSTLSSCGCLVAVDEEELTVRFVHPSVQDFVLQHYIDSDGAGKTRVGCHRTMANIIVTYLSYSIFETQVSTSRAPQIDAGSAPTRVIEAVTASSTIMQNLAMKLLSFRKRPDFDLGKTLTQELGPDRSRKVQQFFFLHYARRWCLNHVAATGAVTLQPYISTLLPVLLEINAESSITGPASDAAFVMAVEKENKELLVLLLKSSRRKFVNFRVDVAARGDARPSKMSPMALAVCKGNEEILRILRDSGEVEPFRGQPEEPSTICLAIYYGDFGVVRSYLDRARMDSDLLRHVCQSGRGLLACAVWAGHLDILKLLIGHGDIVRDLGRLSPAEEAVKRRETPVLEAMLNALGFCLNAGERGRLITYARSIDYREAIPILERLKEYQVPSLD